jgi:hypothetical protein
LRGMGHLRGRGRGPFQPDNIDTVGVSGGFMTSAKNFPPD